MPAQVLPFRFETREVRTLLINDQPWFFAVDICHSLSLRDTNKALLGLDDDEKCEHEQYSGSGRKPVLINESGLYSLILRSRKAEARRFKKWITAEVLPAIRKHGRYEDSQNKMSTLIGQTIGTDGFHILGAVVSGKVRALPIKVRRSAKMKLWAQLHAAYGVRSAEDIPADQLDSARLFVAAYSIEGEYLPAKGVELAASVGLNFPAHGNSWRYEFRDMMNCGWNTQIDQFLCLLEQNKGRSLSIKIEDVSGLKKELISLQHLAETYYKRLEKVRDAALFAAREAKTEIASGLGV